MLPQEDSAPEETSVEMLQLIFKITSNGGALGGGIGSTL